MMKTLIMLTALAFTSSAFAELRITKIFLNGEISQDKVSLFLENGEIVHFPQAQKELVQTAREAFENQLKFTLTKTTQNEKEADLISQINVLPGQITNYNLEREKEMYDPIRFSQIRFQTVDPFEKNNMTKLSSYEAAQSLMEEFNGNTDEDSQCYNRAHMWTYESLVNSNITLGKVWLFFTQKYIREYKYKWWFHISPVAKVDDENGIYALDRGFTKIPYNMENWKNMFMKNKATCPVIKDYTDYEDHQNSEYCYLMYSSQYYWQPWQLESLTKEGTHRFGYKMGELKITYPDALGTRKVRIPTLPDRPVTDFEDSDTETEDETETDTDSTTEDDVSDDYEPRRGDLVLNQRVMHLTDRRITLSKIIEVKRDGSYLVQSLESRINTNAIHVGRDQLAVTEGCQQDICVGDVAINTNKDNVRVKILGLERSGQYVLEFLEGPTRGGRGYKWLRNELAVTSGCLQGLCVGDYAFNTVRQTNVKVIGIQSNGLFVIHFYQDRRHDVTGKDWRRETLRK